jgi:hypothetical protein
MHQSTRKSLSLLAPEHSGIGSWPKPEPLRGYKQHPRDTPGLLILRMSSWIRLIPLGSLLRASRARGIVTSTTIIMTANTTTWNSQSSPTPKMSIHRYRTHQSHRKSRKGQDQMKILRQRQGIVPRVSCPNVACLGFLSIARVGQPMHMKVLITTIDILEAWLSTDHLTVMLAMARNYFEIRIPRSSWSMMDSMGAAVTDATSLRL